MVQQPQRNLADMPGMDTTLFEVLRAYRQGVDTPGSAILPDIRIDLPVPHWAEAAYVEVVTANFTAGQTVDIAVLAIPADERALVYGIQTVRATGDNTVSEFDIVPLSPYTTGGGALSLIILTTASTLLWWPDPGGQQTIDRGIMVSPLLMEPGTVIRMASSGAGVAASTFTVFIYRHRIKLTRARGPELT